MSLPEPVRAALLAAHRPVCAYVYSLSHMRERAAAVRAALPPGAVLLYAMKANSHPSVVAALAEVVDGLEVASGGELALAAETLVASAGPAAGAAPEASSAASENQGPFGGRVTLGGRLAFGGPAKTDDELRAFLAAPGDRTLHVESAQELCRLAWLAPSGRLPRVALRVNRASAGPAGSHRMTGATQFGIGGEELPAIAALARDLEIRIAGFHLHAVSNSLDAAEYARFASDAVAWSVAAAAALEIELTYVNVGGGFGVSYTPDSPGFDLGALDWSGLDLPAGVELVFEPGRFLTAEAGWYAAEVIDLKNTRGTWYALVRGGMHQFRLPVAYRIDAPFEVVPVERWPYPWQRPSVSGAITVAGELCTPNDVLARDQVVDRLRIGDVVVFPRAGAYGWDISPLDYLRHPHPAVMVL